MPKIKKILIANHSHTDIGFTDYQDLVYRQHAEFTDQALDLIEATQSYPEEARYKWTLEVTGMTEYFLERASSTQIDRLREWQKQGAIDIGGMQYNFTPLLTIKQMIRSLYSVRRIRDDVGLSIRTAMQCDVNGISWIFADLLPQLGIDFLTMSVNPFRGGVPKPWPGGCWWESPTGQKLLTWNGLHYLFGRNQAKLGDWRFVEESLTRELSKLENDDAYPFDFLYCQSTNPIRVDNGPPDPRMPDFVRDWNAQGRQPAMEFTTPTAFGDHLRANWGDKLPTWRGDWLDWWSDGVASSAYETGISRATHELLHEGEALGAWAATRGKQLWSSDRAEKLFENASLYDEHTWGAFASIDGWKDRWVRAQWNRKASYAYTASSDAHDLVARGADYLASTLGDRGPEGVFNLGDLDPLKAYPTPNDADVLVINMSPWDREVLVDEPEIRGGAAPAGVLDCFFPRDIPWGGLKPVSPNRRVSGTVPAFGYAFLPVATAPDESDLVASGTTIENAHYRVSINPQTGALSELFDKALGHDFAGTYLGYGIGEYIYETVEDPRGRSALFYADFSWEDFGYGIKDTPFNRTVAHTVTVHDAVIDRGSVSITVEIEARGVHRARCVYTLQHGEKAIAIDWTLDKIDHNDVEAVLIAFPFAMGKPSFRADINGTPFTPNDDQIQGTVRDWYPVNRWVDVSDDTKGVTLAPLDAPLMQLGGITTGRWAKELEPEGPNLVSWALNNHWLVNFKASQSGEIPLRYRLTTHEGACDDAAAARFGAEQATPVIAIRDVLPSGSRSGQFVSSSHGEIEIIHIKPATFGDGVIVRMQNVGYEAGTATLTFAEFEPTAATLTSPDERDGDGLLIKGSSIDVSVSARSVQSIRVRFA
ncbi:hypothetical protein BH09CHL1_BH09CHL1_29160 [soil metagenome]